MSEDKQEGRSEHGKIAVVCGGGGLTGGMFEVGALRALDQALGGGVLTTLDLYAGASAGAMVSTMLAAGLSPREMDEVIVRGTKNRRHLPPLKRGSIYGLDLGMWLWSGAKLPVSMGANLAASMMPGDGLRPVDAMFDSLGSLPAGLFSNAPLADYVDSVLETLGLPKTFEEFPKELMVTAVNLDSGHQVVFGAPGVRNIPIARAVQASAALPLIFRPVRINDQVFVDGGIERNLPVDVAVKAGAGLVIAINPMVPVVNDPRGGGSLMRGNRYLSERGLPAVMDQVFRMMVRSQVVSGLKQMRDRYPEVDLILLEPEAGDWTMFSYHPMRYSARHKIAKHAFEMTTSRLARDSSQLERVFSKHGLDFDSSRLKKSESGSARMATMKKVFRGLERLPGLRKLAVGDDEPTPF
jgi:predicted acylesterase/phospholipase RssA